MADYPGGLERLLFEQAAMQHKLQYEVGALNAQQAQQSAAMDAYCAGLLDEFNQPGRWVFPPSAERRGAEEGRKRAILSELAGREISMIETAKVLKALEPPKAETVFEDAFVYRPPVQKKKPFDWTLPLPEPWASRFTKLYVAMLMATPVYILIALFGV